MRWHPDPEEARQQAVHVQVWAATAIGAGIGALSAYQRPNLSAIWLGASALMSLLTVLVARAPQLRRVVTGTVFIGLLLFAAFALFLVQSLPLALATLFATMGSTAILDTPRRVLFVAIAGLGMVVLSLFADLLTGQAEPMYVYSTMIGAFLALGAITVSSYLGATTWQCTLHNLAQQTREHRELTEQIRQKNAVLEQRVLDRSRQLRARTQELTEHTADLRRSLTHQEQLRQRLYELSVRDELTGVHNRRYFMSTVEDELANVRPLSLMIVDIDHFKRLNDTHGHSHGDEVLIKVSHGIRDTLRTDDTVARIGGEEFGVLVRTGLAEGAALAEQVRAQVAALWPPDRGPVTVSIGVAEASGPAVTTSALLTSADKALYAAKCAGRNRVEVAAGLPRQAGPDTPLTAERP